jgi:hypothetical protein
MNKKEKEKRILVIKQLNEIMSLLWNKVWHFDLYKLMKKKDRDIWDKEIKSKIDNLFK